MSKVAVKAELVSSIFTLVQVEADMPRTKAALSDALRIGAEEMTSQITNGDTRPRSHSWASQQERQEERKRQGGQGHKAQ
jgi:hypothetical protein